MDDFRISSPAQRRLFFALWTLFVMGLFLWQYLDGRSHINDLAIIQARALFDKDVLYRQWVSERGGVYALVTRETPPNPYLHVPERDIETPSGRKLTLMNPAYMTRQVHELGRRHFQIFGHLTSLKPIRPENAPDPWEKEAIQAFEKGAEEVWTRTEIGGMPYLRYMAPLKTEKSCLRCHADQGYKEGQIRGGISVSVPMGPYLAAFKDQVLLSLLIYGALWILGMGGIWGAFRSLERREHRLRQTQEQLDHANHFLNAILNSIQDGISVLDSNLTIQYTNQKMEEWYKAQMPLVGKKCYEAYQGQSEPCDPCPTLKAMATGRVEREMVPGLKGSPVEWLELYSYPLKDPDSGQLKGVVEFVRDVTQPMKTQKELHRLQAAIEQTRHFILITDPDARIVYANPYFEKNTGFSLEEVRGGPPLVFRQSPEAERLLKEEVLPLLHQGSTWSKRMKATIKDGSAVYVDIDASPVFDDHGRLAHIVFVSRDVTLEMQLEAQLQQAQKMEAIGQLAGGVAHDFNNLLQVINGYADIAVTRLGTEHPVAPALQKIHEAGQRAAGLVQQLLAFSRRQVLRPKLLDINEVIADSLKMLRRVIGEHIEIQFIPGENLGFVYADRTMIEQVIMNLCINARDAMPEGGELDLETENVFIDAKYCETHPWAKMGRYVLISVTDTGHGMDAATVERIFDPFFTTKELGRGTGLGLATVYGIVKQHNGMIHVYSEPGVGTTFKVYLPVSERPASSVGTKIPKPVPAGSETILVAEDNDAVRSFTVQALQSAGYKVLEARNGEEVLDLMEKETDTPIHALLLDVVMPKMNGWEVFRTLQARHPGLRVLFMSGYSENAVHINFVIKAGCRLIQKPFSREALLRAVREVLDAENGEPED